MRIKEKRPKGKIVLKKERLNREKNDTKKQKTASPGDESNPVYLQCKMGLTGLHDSPARV